MDVGAPGNESDPEAFPWARSWGVGSPGLGGGPRTPHQSLRPQAWPAGLPCPSQSPIRAHCLWSRPALLLCALASGLTSAARPDVSPGNFPERERTRVRPCSETPRASSTFAVRSRPCLSAKVLQAWLLASHLPHPTPAPTPPPPPRCPLLPQRSAYSTSCWQVRAFWARPTPSLSLVQTTPDRAKAVCAPRRLLSGTVHAGQSGRAVDHELSEGLSWHPPPSLTPPGVFPCTEVTPWKGAGRRRGWEAHGEDPEPPRGPEKETQTPSEPWGWHQAPHRAGRQGPSRGPPPAPGRAPRGGPEEREGQAPTSKMSRMRESRRKRS